jgi:hypothetical protein
LRIEVEELMKIFYDNQATRDIATNLVFYGRTKHIKIDCHFIREKVQSKEIETPFVKSEDQLTYIFTKRLSTKALKNVSCKIRLYNLYNLNLRGSVEK